MKINSQVILSFILALLVSIIGHNSLYAQQKAMFTQYMFNGLVVNPAYSAMDEALNVTALARQQWVGFAGAPNTQTISVHSPIKQSNTSVGFIFLRDQIGEVISENGVLGTLAHKVEVGDDTFFALGLNGGIGKYVGQYSLAGSASAAIDPVFADQNSLRGSLGFGLMFSSQKFYAGFSSPYFFNRDLGSSNTFSSTAHRPHFIMQGGYLKDLGADVKFKPSIMVKYVNGSPVQVDLNANFLLKETLWIGASLRSMDSIDLLAEMQLTPNIQLGYYDFTTSRLAAVEKGSHEIVLNFPILTRGNTSSLPRCYF